METKTIYLTILYITLVCFFGYIIGCYFANTNVIREGARTYPRHVINPITKEDILDINLGIMKDVAKNIKQQAPNAFVIVISNPLDAMVNAFYKISGFSKNMDKSTNPLFIGLLINL